MSEHIVREELKPVDLDGISAAQVEDHWGLYKGYVTQANALRKELAELRAAGQGATLAYADRRRRLGFEYAGLVLHEYYFGNLRVGVTAEAAVGFQAAVAEQYGSFAAWRDDLVNTGKTRGIGWAICYLDTGSGQINNHFVQLHEDGNIPGFVPLLVMDVFEHAYMVDHRATGRPAYIEAFLRNVDWAVVEQRFQAGGVC